MPDAEVKVKPNPKKAKAGRRLLAAIEADIKKLGERADSLQKAKKDIPAMMCMSFMALEELKCRSLAHTRLLEGATGDERELCELVMRVINEKDL